MNENVCNEKMQKKKLDLRVIFPKWMFHLFEFKNANWVDTENKDRESNKGKKTDRCNQRAKLALVPPKNAFFKETEKKKKKK